MYPEYRWEEIVFYVADNYRANFQCHASHGIDSFVINVVLSHFFLTMTAVAPIGKFYWQQKINSKLENTLHGNS